MDAGTNFVQGTRVDADGVPLLVQRFVLTGLRTIDAHLFNGRHVSITFEEFALVSGTELQHVGVLLSREFIAESYTMLEAVVAVLYFPLDAPRQLRALPRTNLSTCTA